MSSKLEYLQRYMSDGKKKKRKKVEKKVARNLAVLDDDIDWRALAPKDDVDLEDPDEAPVVAEIRDESANAVKWQPIKSHGNEEGSGDEGLNEDLSPPRRSTEDLSPPRKRVSDDLSPPRRRKEKFFDSAERDISPPRRDHKVAEGFSVFQKVSKKSEPIRTHSAFGKAQKKGHTSPPQKRRQDPSPPRRRRHDSVDASPRRKGRHDSVDHDSVDASPPRKRRHDFSSPPRRKRHDTMDASPPRRRRHDSVDASPPRKSAGGGQQRKRDALSCSPPRPPPPHKAPRGDSSPPRHARRAKETEFDAGLRTRRDNASARSVRDSIYKNLDPELSGAHAETVHRDKKGRVIDPQVEKVRKREEERVKAEEDEKFMEWGKGLAQVKLAQDKVADDLYEMSKPLARYRDDEDLEKMLKERERDGDPMLAFMKKKKKVKNVKGKPVKEKPTYKGAVPPNRFSVRPGYRWDGVDRSNGFEKAWFARESNKKATAEEAYKWSVEDM